MSVKKEIGFDYDSYINSVRAATYLSDREKEELIQSMEQSRSETKKVIKRTKRNIALLILIVILQLINLYIQLAKHNI